MNIADAITLIRLFLSPLLTAAAPLSVPYFIVYSICGISDVADGAAARLTGRQSARGARLDSAADIVFFVCAFAPLIIHRIICFSAAQLIIIMLCAVIRITSYIISALKFRRAAALHTYSNKLSGILVFIIPYVISAVPVSAVLWVVCSVCTLSAAEELIITIKSSSPNPDIKSIFTMNK